MLSFFLFFNNQTGNYPSDTHATVRPLSFSHTHAHTHRHTRAQERLCNTCHVTHIWRTHLSNTHTYGHDGVGGGGGLGFLSNACSLCRRERVLGAARPSNHTYINPLLLFLLMEPFAERQERLRNANAGFLSVRPIRRSVPPGSISAGRSSVRRDVSGELLLKFTVVFRQF